MQGKYRWTKGLVARLISGFIAGGVVAALLLLAGDQLLRTSTQRLEQTLSGHVRPLAHLHRLQAGIDGVRNLELELTRMRDYYAVTAQLDRLQAEVGIFDKELASFAGPQDGNGERRRLAGHWQQYQASLENLVKAAQAMDMDGAERISNSRSHASYAAIAQILAALVRHTEAAATTAYADTVTEQERLRRGFLLVSLGFGIALALGVGAYGRWLAHRITRLRLGAMRLAAGEQQASIEIDGQDEITDLGHAFNSMQDRVAAREQALRAAQEQLERRVAERTQDLKESNDRLQLLSQAVEQSAIGVLIAARDGGVQYVNAAYQKITGQRGSELLGVDLERLFETAPTREAASLREALAHGLDWEGELHSRRADGALYWEHLRVQGVCDDSGLLTHRLLTREDVTPRRERDEKIAYQAHYDALTGLPNRTLAFDRLAKATAHAKRSGTKAVVMFIDLDNFKQINDTLGHAVGDALLQLAAKRLQGLVRQADSVARLGGDEFLVTMSGLHDGDADPVAHKILQAFGEPFAIDGRELATSPSIGIAVYPDDGLEPAVLLRNADLAMYEAKDAGRCTYRFFNQAIHDESMQRLELERHLRGALERNELYLHYQPLVNAATGRLVGAEALLRWDNPQLGRVGPDRFIPVAEQCGLIVAIGAWVLREACAQAARWREQYGEFTIAVNVSPRQFRSTGFVELVQACVHEFGIPPHQLEVEVTEGLLIRNPTEVQGILEKLAASGVALSMDDFGTGYSSLSYLRAFPFNTIKIDRSFVRDLGEDEDDRALVLAAIRMAKSLGLRVIAEGVEVILQRDFLAANDCDVLQGYLFSRPLGARDFEAAWIPATTVPA